MTHTQIRITPLLPELRTWATELITEHWVSPMIMSRFVWFDTRELPGFVAYYQDQPAGLATYIIMDGECELITLDSLVENKGVGSALLNAVADVSRGANCRRMFLTTANDNLRALQFYQKRNMRIVAVHKGAIDAARNAEKDIPLLGYHDIPMRDELELELQF
ncbi:GNAT family N-acetyltransferase [bacterium]|nr:GNAT family N-acetyltransferase [bacterium]